MVYELTDELIFPAPHLGEDNGLLAVGGDLRPERLLLAYSYGIFPWSDFRRNALEWWCPMDRFVIFPKEIHVSHSMRTLLNKKTYSISFNRNFPEVILHCSVGTDNRIDQQGAWLGPAMIEAYTELHRRGYAMSVEVWHDNSLVGGLYGVTLGHVFCGESMFSLVPSGSKVALVALARLLGQDNEDFIIDCQFETEHLKSMGGRHISYDEYMTYLQD